MSNLAFFFYTLPFYMPRAGDILANRKVWLSRGHLYYVAVTLTFAVGLDIVMLSAKVIGFLALIGLFAYCALIGLFACCSSIAFRLRVDVILSGVALFSFRTLFCLRFRCLFAA